jgi:hypothetical protein
MAIGNASGPGVAMESVIAKNVHVLATVVAMSALLEDGSAKSKLQGGFKSSRGHGKPSSFDWESVHPRATLWELQTVETSYLDLRSLLVQDIIVMRSELLFKSFGVMASDI